MDISKLPKLSQTPAAPDAMPAQEAEVSSADRQAYTPQPTRDESQFDRGSNAGEIWFSLIIGIVFLLMGRRCGSYLLSKVTHQPFPTGVTWGQNVPGHSFNEPVLYPDLEGNVYLSESAMFLFGVAIVFDALMRFILTTGFKAKKAVALCAWMITIGVVLFNLYVASVLMKTNVLPILSLLAVAFGGYTAFQQWGLIQRLGRSSRPVR